MLVECRTCGAETNAPITDDPRLAQCSLCVADGDTLARDRMLALTAARDAVVEAARKYVPDSEHNTLCAANRLRAGACDCGLTTLCAAVEAVCALEAEHGS